MMHPLAGVYVAAVTPLKPDYSPDLGALSSLLDFLARRGCHGILLLGTTGEGPSFSPEERVEILRSALQIRTSAPALKLLAGTGTPSLVETASLTHAAFDLGYDGVVVLPPFYFRKATDDGLFKYFRELIHRSVPEDGLLLGYHIPGLTGIGFSIELLNRLKDAFPRQFGGIKDSSHDASFATRLGSHFGSDLFVLTGTDSYFKLALENHAGGCITAPANLISPELRQIWDRYLQGEDVQVLQEQVSKIRHVLEKYPPFPPILKALLVQRHGFPRWPVRPPLEDISHETLEQLSQELDAASL
jgi:4-hydroxy-tetrahydrodipicolinate synthase